MRGFGGLSYWIAANSRCVGIDEFSYWLATTDGVIEEVLNDHMRAGHTCQGCGRLWPCNMSKRASEALNLLTVALPRQKILAPARAVFESR
jgi:hypothetical protein